MKLFEVSIVLVRNDGSIVDQGIRVHYIRCSNVERLYEWLDAMACNYGGGVMLRQSVKELPFITL